MSDFSRSLEECEPGRLKTWSSRNISEADIFVLLTRSGVGRTQMVACTASILKNRWGRSGYNLSREECVELRNYMQKHGIHLRKFEELVLNVLCGSK